MRLPSPMDHELDEELEVPSGVLTSVTIGLSTETEKEKLAVIKVDAVSEVSDPRLGLPNPTAQCFSCGARNLKSCEGHFGFIKFPYTIQHPYFLSEVIKLLNKICPKCKGLRQDSSAKRAGSASRSQQQRDCRYCSAKSGFWYPRMKFKVSSEDLSRRTAIVVEIDEKLPKKLQKRRLEEVLPYDYWNFIPSDPQHEEISTKPTRRVLSHAQVHHLLQDVDEEVITKFISRADLLFLSHFPVTPNNHRVTEIAHAFSNGQRLIFDERTRVYRKLVDFRGPANELSAHVQNCLKISKLHLDKLSSKDPTNLDKKSTDVSKSSGSRWIKDVFLGKRNDNCFRMVVTGDPNIKLSEIGIPCHVAERLQISEHLNSWNWERLNASCSLRLLEKGEVHVRRKGNLVRLNHTDALQMGDAIYRPLSDGDLVLANRPPSIHPHSLIALSVKVFPVSSVVSINPLCCSPFRGDFDGDCFHGYIPQSLDAQIELQELVTLDRQLINKQNGRNLLSLSQDSLLAAYLLMEDDVSLSHSQIQQLQMFSPQQFESAETNNDAGIGKQLFSMLLPPDFKYSFPSKGGSAWLRDNDSNLFKSLINHYQGKVLDFFYNAQELLCEWLSMRGLTVSLSDLYLTPDSCSRKTMMDDVFYGLQEAEQTCNFKQLMVDSSQDFLMSAEDNEEAMALGVEHLCYEKQRSAALSQASVDAFKQVFWDIQNLAYRYADKENSLLAMFKAGSKGNLLKLVQHSMTLGLQHSLAPLSFRFPHKLTCEAWNALRADETECAKSYIPYAVVENSFLTGLNPLECFAHSVTSRDCSFSDHAELPGTLTRRLMFFLRDLYTSYDGTVRNSYGDQVVQLSYDVGEDTSDGVAGQSVGALSACALSEVAYSALDQPISLLETSPLLNLKNVLECGSKKGKTEQTMSLYLSKKLRSLRHGFELGALEVKKHLECLTFSDIVSTVTIMYSPKTSRTTNFSPWVCHFYVYKEIMKRRGLQVSSIIDSIHKHRKSAAKKSKINLLPLEISVKNGSSAEMQNKHDDTLCITVTVIETNKRSSVQLDKIRSLLIPFLLNSVIKGFREITKVDILWKDGPKSSKTRDGSLGELYIRVSMKKDCSRTNLWSTLMNDCLQIMDMIDWSRSHPENIHNFCSAYGIDAGLKLFLNNLESAVADTGKSVLPQHLLLVANSLSATGEFVGLNSKGLGQQREHASVSSPFMQACFSSPGACFIKAAKAGVVDKLQGSVDALSWGKVPSIGTSGHFEIIYSGEGHKLEKPVDVYNLLATTASHEEDVNREPHHVQSHVSDKCGTPFAFSFAGSAPKGHKMLEFISRSLVRKCLTLGDIQRLSRTLRDILHKYPIDHELSEADKRMAMMALCFHPRKNEKIGSGAQEIKVVNHPEFPSTRCFSVVRKDGTTEDFSYHKCVVSALEVIAPKKVKSYQSRWLKHETA